MTRALPGKCPLLVPIRPRNPQHFHRLCTGLAPLPTSHPHVCAQTAAKPSCVGWQAAADRHGRRYLYAWPAHRGRDARHAGPITHSLPGRTDVRRCRAHVVRRWEPSRGPGCALDGTGMITVLANRKPLPLQMAAEFYAIYQLLRIFLILTPPISVRYGPTVNRGLEVKFS
jgi:hypothetical protein